MECPSLSPDGTRIVYKKRVGNAVRGRFHVLDLATWRETPLARRARSTTRPSGWTTTTCSTGWARNLGVPADGTGHARRYMAGSDSPAVVRAN